MFGRSTTTHRLGHRAEWPRRLTLALLACAGLATAAAAAAQTVPAYHGAADRSGLYVTPDLGWSQASGVQIDPNFNGVIAGNVYAQPLYWLPPGAATGLVIVATESNTVYALHAKTGVVKWQRTLGPAVPHSALDCGNIDPVGVTGTPVIDPASGTLFLDALLNEPNGPRHKIFALSLATGKNLPGWPVNVRAGMNALGHPFDTDAQGQRGALMFAGGQLYVSYGGNWGDCSIYHGTVVQVSTGATPKLTAAWSTRAHGGGIWAQSGIASDGQSLFVATGNTMGARTWADGEAVIRLRPGLARSTSTADYFTPRNWKDLDNSDTDLGGTGPIPIDVPAGGGDKLPRLLALGKDGNAYLLDRANLGGIGKQLAVAHVATSVIISGAARFPTAAAAVLAFVTFGSGAACPAGQSGNLIALRITPSPTTPITTAWCNTLAGRGAPIVTTIDGHSNPIVWAVGAQGDNQLHGFRGTDGAPLHSIGGLSGLQQNATILVAEGHFYVAGTGRVYAFTW